MSLVLSTAPPILPPPSRRRSRTHPPLLSLRTSRRGETGFARAPLASYLDADGRVREVLALPGHAGSVLVLDRDAATLCDRRLVAHLASDEPPENAMLVCRHYLEDPNRHWCRRVRPEDLEIAPLAHDADPGDDLHTPDACVEDRDRNAYRLVLLPGQGSVAQLRWCRRAEQTALPEWEQTSLREVVGAVQCYEPMRTLTKQAIALHSEDSSVAVTRLCCEFDRLCASPVVLNRGLREAVLDAVHRRGTTMSEIALRCGVVKRDRRGNSSGETSWLARRIGIMPEGGEKKITPWIHSDVLATIARKGLGISPREVELQ
ncbi:MAG TPA: hypothetical protein VIJ39_07425 [Solirubrobacteraceae bacterium]